MDEEDRVLLLKRKNEPAKGKWWFPGGRVYRGETRKEAAQRKLREECSLAGEAFEELFTADCLLHFTGGSSHAVTTFYKARIRNGRVTLDHQSADYSWKTWNDWRAVLIHEEVWPFMTRIFCGR
jgi:ADP-ribose pyrophosphatase YjhB (NUDIX family)